MTDQLTQAAYDELRALTGDLAKLQLENHELELHKTRVHADHAQKAAALEPHVALNGDALEREYLTQRNLERLTEQDG
jgi:hypothetical protein